MKVSIPVSIMLERITSRQMTLESLNILFICDIKAQNLIPISPALACPALCLCRCLYRYINKPQTIAIRSWSASSTKMPQCHFKRLPTVRLKCPGGKAAVKYVGDAAECSAEDEEHLKASKTPV